MPYPLAGQRALAEVVSPGPWIAVTFANSWSNVGGGFVTAQYRLLPLFQELELIGHIQNAGASGTSTFSATLVAPYVPNSTQASAPEKVIATNAYASSTSSTIVTLTSSGLLQFQFLPAATTQVEFHCFFSMDA